MATQDSVSLRTERAAQILSVQPSDVLKVLEDSGIYDNSVGIEILDSPTTTIKDLVDILTKTYRTKEGSDVEYPMGKLIKELPAKAAANILKSRVSTDAAIPEVKSVPAPSDIAVLAQALKPIQQWDDKSLLEDFVATRSAETEAELDRRAKHQKFVVLKDPATKNLKKYSPGQEEIDIELTLKLLRDSRKRATPGIIPVLGGVAIVYRITDLNVQDRVVEICPICGEALYQGYCEKCQLNFTEAGEDERAYVRLIVESDGFNKDSFSDHRAVLVSAIKGIDDLKLTWPSLSQKFDELKLTNNLPKLRIIENRPSTTVADPFHMSGKRSY